MCVETRTRAAIALVLTCTAAVAAQGPTVFRAATDVVLVPISVTDRNGRFVHGLTSEHFEIWEGRTRRAARQFSAARVPVSLVVLLDISESMVMGPDTRPTHDARWSDTRRAVEALLTRLDPADEVLFAVFNDRLAASPWTQDRGRILQAFDTIRPSGGTALLQAIAQIAPMFGMARHQRKVLLLISDGNDTQMPPDRLVPPTGHNLGEPASADGPGGGFFESRPTRRALAIEGSRNAVRKSDAVLYAIGIGTRDGVAIDTDLLDGLTKESGGYTEPLRNPSEIAHAIARICDDLQSQYLLTFEPAHADGKYHPIRVRAKDTRLKIRTRAGYVAAPGP